MRGGGYRDVSGSGNGGGGRGDRGRAAGAGGLFAGADLQADAAVGDAVFAEQEDAFGVFRGAAADEAARDAARARARATAPRAVSHANIVPLS
jgi:hypothetical protein